MNALKPIFTFPTDRQLNVIRFNGDGSLAAAGAIDGTVRLWKLSDKLDPLPNLEGHHGWVVGLAFHPKENRLYSADSWGQLRCQLLSDEAPKVLWQNDTAHDGWIRQIALSPDGTILATCGKDGFVRTWSPEGRMLTEYQHNDDVYTIAFAPDGRQLAFGDMHGHAHLFDPVAKKIIRVYDVTATYKLDRLQDVCGLRRLAFTEDGKTLIAAGTIVAHGATIESTPVAFSYDVATGKQKSKFTFGTPKDGFIEDFTFLPDGSILAVTSGSPGEGLMLRFQIEAKEPVDAGTKIANCQSLALHPDNNRVLVAATTPNSAGNGRPKGAEYPINGGPVHLFALAPLPPPPKDKKGNELLVPSLGL